MALEVRGRAVEVAVLAQFQRHAMLGRRGLQGLQNAPVAWAHQHQLGRREAGDVAAQRVGQRGRRVGVVQARVVHGQAALAQGLGKVAHRGEEQRDAGLTRPHVGGLLRRLGHPHRVGGGVEAVERGRAGVELVAQHQHQAAQRGPGHRAVMRPRRHASEQ